jgi:hypothetical protein
MKGNLMRKILIGLLLPCIVLAVGCKKKAEKDPYQLATAVGSIPLNNPDEIQCELKVGHIFVLDGKKGKEKGELQILHAIEEADGKDSPPSPFGSLRFIFSDLKSRRPKLNGAPYKKFEMEDMLVLSNDDGGSVISYFIQKSTGGVIRTIGFIGVERPIGDVYAGVCRQVK